MVIDKLKRIFITHFPDGRVERLNTTTVPVYEFISFHTDLIVYMTEDDDDHDSMLCEVKGNTNDVDGFYDASVVGYIDTTAEFKRLMKGLSLRIDQ